jgi:hypothetical protein
VPRVRQGERRQRSRVSARGRFAWRPPVAVSTRASIPDATSSNQLGQVQLIACHSPELCEVPLRLCHGDLHAGTMSRMAAFRHRLKQTRAGGPRGVWCRGHGLDPPDRGLLSRRQPGSCSNSPRSIGSRCPGRRTVSSPRMRPGAWHAHALFGPDHDTFVATPESILWDDAPMRATCYRGGSGPRSIGRCSRPQDAAPACARSWAAGDHQHGQ